MPNETKKPEQNSAQKKTAPDSAGTSQALQVVDVAVGAVPYTADTVSKTVETWRNPETRSSEIETIQNTVSSLRDSKTRSKEIDVLRKRLAAEIEKAESRGGDVRKQVTDQLVGQARKARERVEPVYRERVEPVVKERVEPVYKRRFEPVYKQRVEPAVKKVRERL